METNAKKLEDGSYGYPKCEGKEMRMGMHLDAKDYYSTTYTCVNCGESIYVKRERDAESKLYWE